MKPSKVLLSARELIAAPGKWAQGSFAKTEKGNPIGALESAAHSFCLIGAVTRSGGGDAHLFLERITPQSPQFFNDHSSHLECVVALEKAALLALSEGQ